MNYLNKKQQTIEKIVIGLIIGIITYVALIAQDEAKNIVRSILLVTILFIGIRLFYFIIPHQMTRILLFIATVYCGFEVFYGYSQILGINHSKNYLYVLTGSFDNPGPFGGFLAVNFSFLGVYAYNNRAKLLEKSRSNISYLFLFLITIAMIVILPSTQSRAAILSIICSLCCFIARTNQGVILDYKLNLKKHQILMAIGIIGFLMSIYLLKKPSADGRLFMDKISIMTICNNKITGAGTGNFGGAYGEMQAHYFENQIKNKGKDDLDWTAINNKERFAADCPTNAFNEYLTIGVEYGPIIMFLVLLVIITSISISYKKNNIWCYGVVSLAVFAFFSYPLHIKQFQIMSPILLAACISDPGVARNGIYTTNFLKDIRDEIKTNCFTKKRELSFLIITIFIIFSFVIINEKKIRQDKQAFSLWNETKHLYQMEYYDYVIEDCKSLLPNLKCNPYFLYTYGLSLNKTGHYKESIEILKLGTKKSSNPMFLNIMGNDYLALGYFNEAEKLYKKAFYMVPNRLYPLTLIANLYYVKGDSVRFKNSVERVEFFIPKIESVTTENLRMNIRELH